MSKQKDSTNAAGRFFEIVLRPMLGKVLQPLFFCETNEGLFSHVVH